MTTATQTQIRRDTAANLNAATPAAGELAYDTTNKRPAIGDGATLGGIKIPNAKDIQNQTFIAGTVGGTGDAITLTNSPVVAAYASNQRFVFKAGASNTGVTTVNVDSLGAKSIKKMISGTLTALAANDIISGGVYEIYYDGTQFQIKGLDETVAASGSMVLLSTQIAAGSATLDFTSVINSTYSSYVFELDNLRPATDGVRCYMRTSTNNGSSYDAGSSNYSWASQEWNTAWASKDTADGVSTAIQIGGSIAIGNAAAEGITGKVHLFTPLNATQNKRVEFETGPIGTTTNTCFVKGMGARLTTADVDAVRFLFDSGNITSGTIRCYGIKAA